MWPNYRCCNFWLRRQKRVENICYKKEWNCFDLCWWFHKWPFRRVRILLGVRTEFQVLRNTRKVPKTTIWRLGVGNCFVHSKFATVCCMFPLFEWRPFFFPWCSRGRIKTCRKTPSQIDSTLFGWLCRSFHSKWTRVFGSCAPFDEVGQITASMPQ